MGKRWEGGLWILEAGSMDVADLKDSKVGEHVVCALHCIGDISMVSPEIHSSH